MTYSPTRYQLTHLLQDAWGRLGQLSTWAATGGSATTSINTAWAGVEDEVFEDDDAGLIYGSVVVTESTDNAAPEGEIARITDYDSSSQTITHDTLSASVQSGDRIGIVSPLFPYEDMKRMADLAIRKLGKLDLIDSSIVVVAGQTEYTLPIRSAPKAVKMRTNAASGDYKSEFIQPWSVKPATAGGFWTLVVPDLPSGYVLELLYEDFHPKLNVYDDDIAEIIVPELATAALVAEAYQWYNNRINGSNQYLLQRENKAIQDLEQAKAMYPVRKIQRQVQGFPHWGTRSDFVPLTSDERA